MTMWVSYLTICLYCFTRILDYTIKYKRIKLFIHKCIIEIYLWYVCFTFIYKNQQIWLFTTYCVFRACCNVFFILIVIQNAFKTNHKCSINSAIISVKVQIHYLFNNKSLSLFLTYWKGVLSICNGINVNLFISECKL